MIKNLRIEWLKLAKNNSFWIVLSIFVLFSAFMLKTYVIDERVKELSELLTVTLAALSLPIIFFNGFIPTIIGQEFRFNTLKFELLGGFTRLQKFFANLGSIALYALIFSLLFGLFSVLFLWIDLSQFPTFNGAVLKNWLLILGIFFYYCYFLNTLTLAIRNTGLTMFIAFVYFFVNTYLSSTEAYAKIASLFPVGALYNIITPLIETDPNKLPKDIFDPYWVIAISTIVFLLINLWQLKYRDVR